MEYKKKFLIKLIGCDATTEIETDLTYMEYLFLKKISYISKRKSECICEPTMEISIIKNKKENNDDDE